MLVYQRVDGLPFSKNDDFPGFVPPRSAGPSAFPRAPPPGPPPPPPEPSEGSESEESHGTQVGPAADSDFLGRNFGGIDGFMMDLCSIFMERCLV